MEYTVNKTMHGTVYVMTGRFIFSDHDRFSDLMEEVRLSSENTHILDFARLGFVDSAALGMLVVLRDICDQTRKKICIKNPQGKVAEILKATKLDELFGVA